MVNTMEEIKRIVGEDEFERVCNMSSAEELYDDMQKTLLPESEELNEESLSAVVGGMSSWQAIKIVAVAYYDLCRYGNGAKTYSWNKVNEALSICDELNLKVKKYSIDALKWGLEHLRG